MAHFMMLPGQDLGFDASRNSLVLGAGKTANVYLVGGHEHEIKVENGTAVTVASKDVDDKGSHSGLHLAKTDFARKVSIKAGAGSGSADVTSYDSRGFITALITVYVTGKDEGRRIDDKSMDPEMREEIDSLPLREAVIRVAEDQMQSFIRGGQNAQWARRYHLPESYGDKWCGAFAHWCWQRACDVKKISNPFGSSGETFLSPQKAISWAMHNPDKGQLFQYSGPDPYKGGKAVQELVELSGDGSSVQPGDLALWREKSTGHFKHVSFVKSLDGVTLTDVNGNAGDAGAKAPLKIITHPNVKEKVKGNYRCFFLHVNA
jgi:hypothetical protein